MTNTLHRYGTKESFVDDYVVIALPAKGGKQDGDPLPALKRFLQIAVEYHPVSIGDARHGGSTRPIYHRHLWQHFFADRPSEPDFQTVIDGVDNATTFSAVFDKRENAAAFVNRLAKEDFGLSINVSTTVENGFQCCKDAGVTRHSVGYSLGYEGIPDNLPDRHALMLSSMCGHGLVSLAMAKKMIGFVKENRLKPDKAAASMGRFCSCGIFNFTRAKRIIEEARTTSF